MNRLLAAYPARLRRKHGDELIATLHEMAGPHGRPRRPDQVRLVLDGLRERFRPPVRHRPLALLTAVVALLVGGALGAAAGSWLGTLSYAELPTTMPVGAQTTHVNVADRYLWAEAAFPSGADAAYAVQQTRRELASAGWRPGPIGSREGVLANVHFAAEQGGVRLDVYAYPSLGSVTIAGWPTRPAPYLPLTIAGTVLGLLAGWPAGVALAHRIQAARRPLRSGTLTAMGFALILPSAVGFVASLWTYLTVSDPLGTGGLVHVHGFAFGPTLDFMRALNMGEGWYLTPSDFQQLPLFGFAVLALAATLARPRYAYEAVA
ncbi:hypothetical protein Aab01nite_65070 [Paractinoplanes abujensis]|uniref:Uncharacterized protein n=1 Tax=Paractinoplanes abujensis TaxID=882441 RepID=A0A7W7CSP4_9ACTN|nr:hypothetical protein [Actinoplanes abujensis]MBB4692583.1 hypothetical protein [Actinoplanes abujensis]GID22917.1 hypothetical protein Aab01nite_65070 [Actinoplanes abujensis]